MEIIEFVQGWEAHSSNWGKFYVRGFGDDAVAEDFEENVDTKHEYWQGYAVGEVADGHVFTVFSQEGNKRGTNAFDFYICKTDATAEIQRISGPYSSWIQGKFSIIAHGAKKTKAPRLMDWLQTSNWERLSNGQRKRLAEVFGTYIQKRGCKFPPLDQVKEAINGN